MSPGALGAFTWLLLFQLAGEVAVRGLRLPLPGPVAGMLLLLAVLVVRGTVPATLRAIGNTLVQHLMLLLVPATAAVTLHLGRLGDEWLPILLGGVGGAAVTMAITALTLRLLRAGRTERGR